MILERVDFAKATDPELQIAAKFAGLDEMGLADLIDADRLTKKYRTALVDGLVTCGYAGIMIDPKNRITNPDALVPFEVAMPVK